ncbi:MAG: CehA/McbA family metallohydrolase [Planctomycetaceae bacterium]
MSPQRIAVFLLVLLFILFGISLAATFSLLPEKVATHFDITGLPDGWMSRTLHLIFIGLFGIGFPLLIIGICWSVRYVSPVTINIPHRDYWLAEERRLESVDFVFRHSIWLGCLGIAFITGLHWAVVLANRQQPPHLSTPMILGIAGGFIAGVTVWIIFLYRRFPAPPADYKKPPTESDGGGVTATAVILILMFGADARGEQPAIIAVEGQPLAANVTRVVESYHTLGVPFPKELTDPLKDATQARDSEQMQKLLDPHVLFTVHINPESRVKVQRGPAKAELQQFGFTPVLIKILNDSTVTKRLRMLSPQSGAVYAGVAKLSMQRQQSLELMANENTSRSTERFLSVSMHDQPPMLDRLSGLEVEYAIGLILSTEKGKREATIGFDLGDSEQDLGSRGEVAVLFNVSPAISVRLSVLDDDGIPATAALVIHDKQGRVFPPQAKRLAPDFFFQPQIYRADGETVLLPPGEFTVQSGRGPEYWVRTSNWLVEPTGKLRRIASDGKAAATDTNAIEVRLERWVNPFKSGFYSGDHHIHAAGCAHYTSPTEGVMPEDMLRQVKGEALNVGCVLTWGPCYRFQRQFFSPRPNSLSEPLTLLKYDLEISGFGSQALGHVCLLNLQDQTYPGSEGTETKGWPLWTTPVMRWAKKQGGVTGYAHSASGLAIEPIPAAKRLLARCDVDGNGKVSATEAGSTLLPEAFASIDRNSDGMIDLAEMTESHNRVSDQLPNLAIPEMNGVGAMEICVTTAEGVCDFISAMDTRRIQEWNTWYHILNCGFPLKVSGETDFPCMSSRRIGQGRVYVQLGKVTHLNYAAWCQGLANGQSYVSDGFAHALQFQVQDQSPGNVPVTLAANGSVTVKAKVVFAPQTPETVAQGMIVPEGGRRLVGDTVELHGPRSDRLVTGGERLVEIIVNGQPVASQKVAADGKPHDLSFEIPISRSSWVALRHFPQLHTNPVNVIVAGQPIRASRASARWCDDVIDLLWKNRQKVIPEAERAEAFQTFEKARQTYRQIASESP